MAKIKDDAWIDSKILSDEFFKEIKNFVERVHEGKTGILSWLFFVNILEIFRRQRIQFI